MCWIRTCIFWCPDVRLGILVVAAAAVPIEFLMLRDVAVVVVAVIDLSRRRRRHELFSSAIVVVLLLPSRWDRLRRRRRRRGFAFEIDHRRPPLRHRLRRLRCRRDIFIRSDRRRHRRLVVVLDGFVLASLGGGSWRLVSRARSGRSENRPDRPRACRAPKSSNSIRTLLRTPHRICRRPDPGIRPPGLVVFSGALTSIIAARLRRNCQLLFPASALRACIYREARAPYFAIFLCSNVSLELLDVPFEVSRRRIWNACLPSSSSSSSQILN